MEEDVMDKLEDMASVRDFDPLTGSIPATKVEITVSCRNLLDKDTFSKSDPLCVLYTQGIETKQWRENPYRYLASRLQTSILSRNISSIAATRSARRKYPIQATRQPSTGERMVLQPYCHEDPSFGLVQQ